MWMLPREVTMRDSRFWKVVAVAALAVAALYVTSPLWGPAGSPGAPYVHAAGGAAGGMIAYVGKVQGQEKVYILDTQNKAVLIYAASNGSSSFNFVAGRHYGTDVAGCAKSRTKDLPYQQRGYPFKTMQVLAGTR